MEVFTINYVWSLVSMFCSQHIAFSGVYSDGDFMIHFAGLDDKQGWTNKILRERKSQADLNSQLV
jgi:hypothetical protein